MSQPLRPAQRPRLRGAAAWALVGALLFAQWLGLAHAVAHAGHAHAPHQVSGTVPALDDLFGHSANDKGACRLLDQAAAADGLLAAPTLPPLLPPAEPVQRALHCSGVPAYSATYLARAPPAAA